MLHRIAQAVAKTIRGIKAAIRARPTVFASVTILVFTLHVFLPPLVLSVVRNTANYFAFNPWLSKLPEYLASSNIALERKLEFLPNLALFWFSSSSPYGVEWGFAVDVTDLFRFLLMSLLFGAYFALWFYRRDEAPQLGWGRKTGRPAGVAGSLVSILGLSTGPCSVVGCGAPVIPVVGLAFVGLSSGTLKFLAQLSGAATPAVLVAMTAGVAYLGWLVGTRRSNPSWSSPPSFSSS